MPAYSRPLSPANARSGHCPGFTLIELMITLAIVAILVSIAYPSYQEHLRKGRRAAAQSFMLELASRQQQYLLDARAYAVGPGALTTLNLAAPADVTRFYAVAVTPDAPESPPVYSIVATPIGGSTQSPDGVLTLNHLGAKTRGGTAGW
jgi:type IV pilus assembly protein PilE